MCDVASVTSAVGPVQAGVPGLQQFTTDAVSENFILGNWCKIAEWHGERVWYRARVVLFCNNDLTVVTCTGSTPATTVKKRA